MNSLDKKLYKLIRYNFVWSSLISITLFLSIFRTILPWWFDKIFTSMAIGGGFVYSLFFAINQIKEVKKLRRRLNGKQ